MNDFFRESLFAGVTLSLLSYFIGSVLKKKFKLGIFNPLLISIIITIIETTITILRRITISIITIITLMARRIRRTRVVRSRHLLLQSSQKYRKFLKLLFQKASALRI